MPQRGLTTEVAATVCVRAPNWVGDVVMATPALRCIRSAFPDSRIVVVVRDSVAPVLRGAPWFDRIIPYPCPRPGLAATASFLRCVGAVRAERAGLGLILPNSFSSALMFLLAGVSRRAGYIRDARRCLLTAAVERPSRNGAFQPTYMVDYYLALCEELGLQCTSRRMELPFSDDDAARTRILLDGAGVDPDLPLVLLHPGAGFGPAKLWPEQNWGELAALLAEEFHAQVACIGAPSGSEQAQRIGGHSPTALLDLTSCGIDLHLLKCLVRASLLLVSTDSGPRHYGIALGVPTVCIMGPNHPEYSTSDLPHDRVVRVDVECGPCQQKTCHTDHRCMTRITPGMVMDECRRALDDNGEAT